MKIGDIVVPREGFSLLSGSDVLYHYAICVSVDPFTIVSGDGNMLWACVDVDNVKRLCPAAEEIVDVAKARYARYMGENGAESVETLATVYVSNIESQLEYSRQRVSETRVGNVIHVVENSGWIKDGERTVLESVYCAESGNYIGTLDHYEQLVKMGITEGYATASGKNGTVAIGFNPTENKWYGWSHRALYGFGVGSTVKFGDSAYKPTNKEDLQRAMEAFWDIGIVRPCGNDKTCKTVITSIEHDVYDPDDMVLGIGILMNTETSFSFDRPPFKSTHFTPYPKVWGRGEWIAQTLEDAKQMAIDFADAVG